MFEFISPNDVEIVETRDGFVRGKMIANPAWTQGKQLYGSYNGLPPKTGAIRAESLEAYFSWVESTKRKPLNQQSSLRIATGSGFNAIDTFDQALDIYRDRPWEVRKFDPNDAPLKFAENVGNQVEFDVTGDYIDMGRFLDGEPECWGHNVMGNPQGLFATILINVSVSAYVDASVLNHRASRVVRLIDWLENQHIRTEIILLCCCECHYSEIVIKRYEDAINLDSIAVATHSDFFRRMTFRGFEFSDTNKPNYGMPRYWREGGMQLPPLNANGIVIASDLHISVYETDISFNTLEKNLENALEEGDRFYRSTV